MTKLSHRGMRLHVVDEGTGPAVLFLHAFPLSAAMWNAQVSALKGKFRAIAVDLPGFGKSSAPTEPMSMEIFADCALAALDARGIADAAVVGLSMGGYIAFELQSKAPQRVRQLVLSDTRATPDTDDGKRAREATARAVEADGLEVLVERMIPNLVSHEATPKVWRDVERLILQSSVEGAAAALRGMARRRDFTGHLGELRCPTLVLTGNHDALVPIAEAQHLAEAIPGAKLEIISGAGHLSNLEQPAAFNAALLGFLAV